MPKFTPVDNSIKITPEIQHQFSNQSFINHKYNLESLISKPVQVQSKLDPLIQDVSDIKKDTSSIRYESKKTNAQLEVGNKISDEHLTEIQNLNDTISTLKHQLEIERLKNESAQNKLSAKDWKILAIGFLCTIIGMFIEHFIL